MINLNGVTEQAISRNYENLLKTKSTSDRRLLNTFRNSNRIDRERRDHRSHLAHNRNSRNSLLYELAFKTKNVMPGQYFNTDLQCQLIFGPGSTICPYMSPCKRLWCTSGSTLQLNPSFENDISNHLHTHLHFRRRQEILATYDVADTGCKTQHIPWAEGSSCERLTNTTTEEYHNTQYDEHWCYKGECVSKQRFLESNHVIDGGWSDWSGWSNCTRSCGGGIQSSSRSCNNPEPKNGGQYCLGQRKRYRSCHINKCSNNVPDFRAEQVINFSFVPSFA